MKTLPNSIDAEHAVIGCMLLNQECAERATELQESDFYNTRCQAFIKAIKKAIGQKLKPDLPTVSKFLEHSDIMIIKDIIENTFTTANFNYYLKVLLDLSRRRQIINSAGKMAENAYNVDLDADEILNDAQKNILNISGSQQSDITPVTQILNNVINDVEERAKNKGKLPGLSTSFQLFDLKTGGLMPSDLIIIAARPGMGKTALALNIAQNASMGLKVPTAIFSLEMSKEQLVNRMLTSLCMIEGNQMKFGALSDEQWRKLADCCKYFDDDLLKIDDTPALTIAQITGKCRKLKKQAGQLGLIVIDYLQLMGGKGDRREVVEENSRGAKVLAKEMNCPVVLLSQLSRAPEMRADHRPVLSDLRETGGIEQDADIVSFLYRDDYYNPDSDKKNIAELIIAKQRNGSTGTIELVWLGSYTKFANLERYRG